MRWRWLFGALGAFVVLALLAGRPAAAQQATDKSEEAAAIAPGLVLVGFKSDASIKSADAALKDIGAQVIEALPVGGMSLLRVTPGSERSIVAALRRMPEVAYADLNYIRQIQAVPNDPYYGPYQWNMPLINAPAAWDRPQGAGTTVGILDTGLDYGHPDLAGRAAPGSGRVYDQASGNCGVASTPNDDNGHGTHLAGIIAANSNNAVGVAGVSWTSTILPFKAGNRTGQLCSSDWIYGLDWLLDRGARVINMSFAGASYSNAEQVAINNAWARGAVLVASSGNLGVSAPYYPASYDNVLSVGSVNRNLLRSAFSNYNAALDLVAPGGDRPVSAIVCGDSIFSTYWRGAVASGYNSLCGTSFAAAHVSGAATLLMADFPALNNAQVRDFLRNTAIDLGPRGADAEYGAGLLNIGAAVLAAGPPLPTATPTSTPVQPIPTSTSTPVQATPTSGIGCIFADVCPADYFYNPVLQLGRRGALSGYGDNTFRPFTNTTRGQIAKILVVAFNWPIVTAGGPHFRDVPVNNVFYPYVETAYNRGVISGYLCGLSCSEYRWFADVTRAQLSKIVVAAAGWQPDLRGAPHFRDVSMSNAFYSSIETAYNHGIISGYGCGNGCLQFRPNSSATRGQIAKIIYQAIGSP